MSATELLFFDSIIPGLIVAALYMATYLSLVHLLRYPSQWQRSPSLALLRTAGLATVLVAYISFSTDGLNIATLAVSASFLTVLFLLIAAPAIELNHAAGFAHHAQLNTWPVMEITRACGCCYPRSLSVSRMRTSSSWYFSQQLC